MSEAAIRIPVELDAEERSALALERIADAVELIRDRVELVLELLPIPCDVVDADEVGGPIEELPDAR